MNLKIFWYKDAKPGIKQRISVRELKHLKVATFDKPAYATHMAGTPQYEKLAIILNLLTPEGRGSAYHYIITEEEYEAIMED